MDQKTNKKGLLSAAGILALATILVKVIGLLYKVPISHFLGDEGMGYFNAAYTIYSFLFLLGSAGVPKAITLLVSEKIAQGDENGAWRIFYAARRFFFLFGSLLFLILFVFARPLAVLIGSPDASATVRMISPCLIFVCVSGVDRGYLSALESFSQTAISSVIEGAFKLIVGVGMIFLGEWLKFSLPYLSAACIFGVTVGAFISMLYLEANIKKRKDITRQILDFEMQKEVKRVVRIALPIALGSAAAGFGSIVDLSMIMRRLEAGGMSAQAATAAYGNYTTLAVPMLQLVSSLLSPFALVLMPRLSAYHAQGREADFSETLHFGMRSITFFSVPIFVVFFFFSEPLLALLFSMDSARIAAPLLRMLSLGVLLLSMLILINTALEAIGKVHIQMYSMVLGLAVKIPITYFLLGNSNIGIAAAPLGTVISYAVSFIFSSIFLNQFNLFSILGVHVLPFFNSMLAFFPTVLLFRRFSYVQISFFVTLLAFTVFAGVYIFFSFIFGGFQNFRRVKRQID